ncbi:MAG: bifunctional UDP-4-keto-pentose/UDP-xylose synthase [Deltaproteobacteria bacterium]|nr:bifunctional UDP-4-keto-pentose/UDP-xylose synthase [Deltaproteobacteria bacterium]
MRIFIPGVNGFIGNALVRRIIAETDWYVTGIDVDKDRLERELLTNDRFEFHHGDMSISREWVEFQVKRCDVVIPLAAIAIPVLYIEKPLKVFQLDFMENLHIVEHAARYEKRIIFPSTSEVYGMVGDAHFREDESNCVTGPINKHRWIYSCAKQLLDRVIHAYRYEQGLNYTLFRPFNWTGPGLDRIEQAHKIGHSRVVTKFIANIMHNEPINLVDGGEQRRCFTYLDDGIEGMMRIIRNKDNKADGEIFNLGNPNGDLSMRELADLLIGLYAAHPRAKKFPFTAGTRVVDGKTYYGAGYQDIPMRRPSIDKARELLGWEPQTSLEDSMRQTLNWFLDLDGDK